MLRSYIVKKFIKTTYLTSLYISLFFIAIQLFRIGFVLTGLSPVHTLTFLSVWITFYFIYFLPDGIAVSATYNMFTLKEKKLLHIMYSFGIEPKKLLAYTLTGTLGVFTVGTISAFLLHEEDLNFARNVLLIHHQEKVMKTLPEKTFYNMGDFVIYVGEKEGRKLSDVFFKYKDFTVIARSAVYEGKGRFRFRGGSLIIKMEGKYFITFFDNYTLDTLRIVGPKKREMRIYKERIYNLVNIFTSLPLALAGFFIALKVLRYHTQVYYASAILIILKEIFMFAFKLYLF